MKRILLAALFVFVSTQSHAGKFRPWQPHLTASIDKTTVHIGESAHVTYSTQHATSVQCHITHLARFFGKSDGLVVPLSGQYDVTPTKTGTWTEHLRAFRRIVDINQDGKADGSRRSVGITFEIEVLPIATGHAGGAPAKNHIDSGLGNELSKQENDCE